MDRGFELYLLDGTLKSHIPSHTLTQVTTISAGTLYTDFTGRLTSILTYAPQTILHPAARVIKVSEKVGLADWVPGLEVLCG